MFAIAPQQIRDLIVFLRFHKPVCHLFLYLRLRRRLVDVLTQPQIYVKICSNNGEIDFNYTLYATTYEEPGNVVVF